MRPGALVPALHSPASLAPAPSVAHLRQHSTERRLRYLDKLDTLNLACDVAVLITHCPVRAYAIGTRAAMSDLPGGPDNDEITKEDIDVMEKIVEDAVAAGAMGFSTSRIILHRDSSGNLTPGSLAQEAEMLALSRGIAAGGGGVFEGAFDFATYDDVPAAERDPDKQKIFFEREWHWMEAGAREYGLHFSFGAGPDIFRRMRKFNEEVGERRFNSQVLIRPQVHTTTGDASRWLFLHTAVLQKGDPDHVQGPHQPLPAPLLLPEPRARRRAGLVQRGLHDALAGHAAHPIRPR